MKNDSPQKRYQAHVDAITDQLGAQASTGNVMLARRAAGLAMLCEEQEAELAKSGRMAEAKRYISQIKELKNLAIALGITLNPRTATNGQRAAAIQDGHAALMLDEDT